MEQKYQKRKSYFQDFLPDIFISIKEIETVILLPDILISIQEKLSSYFRVFLFQPNKNWLQSISLTHGTHNLAARYLLPTHATFPHASSWRTGHRKVAADIYTLSPWDRYGFRGQDHAFLLHSFTASECQTCLLILRWNVLDFSSVIIVSSQVNICFRRLFKLVRFQGSRLSLHSFAASKCQACLLILRWNVLVFSSVIMFSSNTCFRRLLGMLRFQGSMSSLFTSLHI